MTQCKVLPVAPATSLQRKSPQLRHDETESRPHIIPSEQPKVIPIRTRRQQASATSRSSSNTQGFLTPPSSEDERYQNSSSGDIGGNNLCDDGEHVHTAFQEYTLPEHHLFQRVRRGVFPAARTKAQTWIANGPHVDPRRACPFYAFDPDSNQQCLMDDLQSNEDVNVHLRCRHLKSPYCPRCYSIFRTVVARDCHILESNCELVKPRHIDGINYYQESRLANLDTEYLDDVEYWRSIWAIVLPDQKPVASPYLDQGRGLVSSMVREYWSMYGRQCVSQYLESRDLLRLGDEKAQAALCKLTLDDLVRDIIEGRWLN